MASTAPARPSAFSTPSSPKRPAKRVTFSKPPSTNMNGPLYMQTANEVVLVRRVRRRNEPPFNQFIRWIVDNQTGLSFNLVVLLFLAHSFFTQLRVHTAKFFTLSYYNPATGLYNLGKDDAYLVLFSIVVLTGLRASAMEYILAPFAKNSGLTKKKAITRFSEQGWMIFYYGVFYPLGVYLYCQSPYFFNMENLWTGWPGREMRGLLKAYILVQLSFWFQQILVINIEERRKDHWQMLTHHFVTVTLMLGSYMYRHTPVANVILILMDVSDIFLSLAKCLKYMGYSTVCDLTFGAFMLSWFVCRHVFFVMVIYSVWKQTPRIMPTGCFRGSAAASLSSVPVPVGPNEVSPLASTITRFTPLDAAASNKLAFLLEPMFDSEGAICYNEVVKWSFLSVLLFLQLMIIVWFCMIVRVAIRVINGAGAEDSRSDDEEDEDEEEEEEDEKDSGGKDEEDGEAERGMEKMKMKSKAANEMYEAPALEEEVGVEAIDFKGWERRQGLKRTTSSAATGVSLPGHSDRKELLGRIGCEKQVD